MPVYHLRSWLTLTLQDSLDYFVEGATLDDAIDHLYVLQQLANDSGSEVQNDRVTVPMGRAHPGVLPLDPEEIIDGDSNIKEVPPNKTETERKST